MAGTHKEIHSLDEKYALENDKKFFVMSTFSDKEPQVLRISKTFRTFLKSRLIRKVAEIHRHVLRRGQELLNSWAPISPETRVHSRTSAAGQSPDCSLQNNPIVQWKSGRPVY